MAVSDTQKVDLLYKQAFRVAKTDTASNKDPNNESTVSPLLVRGDKVWIDAGSIPAVPAAVTNIVQAYTTNGSAIQCTADNTTTPIGGIYPTWQTGLSNWIPPEFSSQYAIAVYVDTTGSTTPTTTGTQIFAAGSGGTGEYYFDYVAGVLNFIGGTIPTALTSGKSIFVVGYRYIGNVGINTNVALGNTTITGFVNVSSTANVGGIATFRANVVANGQLIVSNAVSLGNTTITGFINVSSDATVNGTLTVSSNSTVNTTVTATQIQIANSTATSNLTLAGLAVGTTIANSTVIAAGANVIVNTTTVFVGNSTVNASHTATLLQVANSTSTANITPLGLAVGTTVANSTVLAAGANVYANATTIFAGNSTVNASHTATLLQVANSTSTANLNPTGLAVGTTVANSTAIAVGSNVVANTTTILVGNTTVNASATSTLIRVANSTSAANLNPQGLAVGTTVANSTVLAAGANVYANTTALYVGNSTIYSSITATSISGNGSSITSVNAATVGGNTASDLRTYADTTANTAYTNAVTYSSNATNISSGTLNTARLPATANITTSINVGSNVNLSTTQINVGNSTVNSVVTSSAITANTVAIRNSTDYTPVVPSTFAAWKEGRVYYDSEEKTIVIQGAGSSDVDLSVGQREWVRCRNSSGTTIAKGKPVYVTGVHIPGDPTHGHHPTIDLADASDGTKYKAIGVTAEPIADGAHGYVIVRGYIEGVDTSALTSNQTVHLGYATPGDLVTAAPTYPNYPFEIGRCLTSDATNGTLYIDMLDQTFDQFRVTTAAYFGGSVTVTGDFNITGNVNSSAVNNLSVKDNFIYLGTGDTIASATFTGSGLNDLTFRGVFEGGSSTTYYVKIDGTGATDTFAWSKDNFATTIASGIAITGDLQELDNGIEVEFNATTGHTLNAKWSGTATPINVDVGWVSNYNDGAYAHTGFFRDASDGIYKLFKGYTPEPDAAVNIDTTHATFALADLQANTFIGNLSGTFDGQNAAYYTGLSSNAYANAIAYAANATNLTSGTVNNARLNAANTSQSGIVQLIDAVNNTSITIAATANTVKTAYDAAIAANTLAAGKLATTGGTVNGDLTVTGTTYLGGTANSESLRVNSVAGATRWMEINGSVSSDILTYAKVATAGNPGFKWATAGSGVHDFASGSSVTNVQLRVAHTANAVNYVQVTGAATGSTPTISTQGSDTNAGMVVRSKGTGVLYLETVGAADVRILPRGVRSFSVNGVTSGVNFGYVTGSVASAAPIFGVDGTDTNIDLTLTPKGTGAVATSGPLQVETDTVITTKTLTTTATTADQVIASFSASTYRSAEFIIQATDTTGTKYHKVKMLAVHNGSSVEYVEYGAINLGGECGSFLAAYSAGDIQLCVTPYSTNSTVFKVVCILTKV